MAPEDDAPRERGEDDSETPPRIAIGSRRSPDEPAWTRLLAPLRSEGAAFRAVLVALAVCVAIAAVVLLARAL